MNQKYNEIIDAASDYAPVVARRTVAADKQIDSKLSISEDEKATLQLAPIRKTEAYQSYRGEREPSSGEVATMPLPELGMPVAEIDLDDLRADDQLLIETGHSVYSFTITDPVAPSGKLLGGILGNRLIEAWLLPPHRDTRGLRIFHRRLQAGTKVSFLMEWEKGLRTLTTSTVTRLVHRKKV